MKLRMLAPVAVAVLFWSCAPAPKTEAPTAPDTAGVIDAYRTWVLSQADSFLTEAEAFAAAVIAGDRSKAQALYAPSRMYFERIEPIAEALGDFDPRLDAREGDVPAEEWRGYHKLEQLLWSKDDPKNGASVAQTLVDDVRLLRAQLETAEITISSLVTGAVELLNEVSTSKVTGEEERYSHTDLWDFQANVEGAAKVWELLSPATKTAEAALAATLDERFAALFALLTKHRQGEGFKSYTDLKPEEVKELSASVDALAEPLAQLGRIFPAE